MSWFERIAIYNKQNKHYYTQANHYYYYCAYFTYTYTAHKITKEDLTAFDIIRFVKYTHKLPWERIALHYTRGNATTNNLRRNFFSLSLSPSLSLHLTLNSYYLFYTFFFKLISRLQKCQMNTQQFIQIMRNYSMAVIIRLIHVSFCFTCTQFAYRCCLFLFFISTKKNV